MAKTTTETEVTIEALLEQRSQYEEWILRLDTSGDKASATVRQRVRGDYEARLESVMEQLRGRSATIAEELERQHASQAELDRERRTAEEALAEAEVRHSVGEYSEEEWRRHSEQSKSGIEQLRTRLRAIGGEITRLTEIQALIAGTRAAAAPAPPPPAARAPRPEVVEQALLVTHVADEMEPVEPAPPPAKPRTQPEPTSAPVDEMAFLKSVSDDEPSRMAGRRPSNPGMPAVTSTAAPRDSSTPSAAAAAGGGGKAASGVAKTLKCGECGTLNRPTEWYCERCGAELAGV
jgi:hypothetical protein